MFQPEGNPRVYDLEAINGKKPRQRHKTHVWWMADGFGGGGGVSTLEFSMSAKEKGERWGRGKARVKCV